MTAVASAAPVSLLVRRPEGMLLKFLFWSAVVHAALFSVALVYAKLHEEAAIDLDQKPIKATLVRPDGVLHSHSEHARVDLIE